MRHTRISKVLKDNFRGYGSGTRSAYSKQVGPFSEFVRETYGTERIAPEQYREAVQSYLDNCAERGLKTTSVHNYAAALAAGTNTKMADYEYAKREPPTHNDAVRITSGSENITAIADAIGLRHIEYGRLRGGDLVERGGMTFVSLDKGKGGKPQEQLILPDRVSEVKEIFEGVKHGERVFSSDEVKAAHNSNLHAARRAAARDAYEYFKGLSSEERQPYREEMERRFYERGKTYAWEKYQERLHTTPEITVRGVNRDRCDDRGIGYSFDREATMMTSVFNLAHYREDVTVHHYLL